LALGEKVEKKACKSYLVKGKVYTRDADPVQALSERGYGEKVKDRVEFSPYEVLYLLSEGWLEVYRGRPRKKVTFEELLNEYMQADKSLWSKYLVYRDLRERGYVVKLGFGKGANFRVYIRGAYGKEAARFLVHSILEGEPIPVNKLVYALKSARSLKKEAILGVIERRGEIVYYSLSQFNP